jgi:ADP-ribose pyrophosphatase
VQFEVLSPIISKSFPAARRSGARVPAFCATTIHAVADSAGFRILCSMASGSPKQIVTSGKYVNLATRNGWEFVERKNICGIVGIVAVTDEGKILLIEQYRPPMDNIVFELPAGLAGDIAGSESEDLAVAARRELLEETGYEAREMIRLVDGASSAGITDEVVTLYRATGLRKSGHGGGDGNERLTLHEVPLATALDWLAARCREGACVDMKVYSGLYFAKLPGA